MNIFKELDRALEAMKRWPASTDYERGFEEGLIAAKGMVFPLWERSIAEASFVPPVPLHTCDNNVPFHDYNCAKCVPWPESPKGEETR